MKIKELLLSSIPYTDSIVENMPDDIWKNTTTCAPWDLKELFNHVTYEWLWAVDLLGGKTIKEVGKKYDGDVLGKKPFESYKKASEAFKSIVLEANESQTVHLSYSDVAASEYMFQLSVEALIHGWDLAVSSGQKTEIPKKLADELYDIAIKHKIEIESSGVYGTQKQVSKNADVRVRLLGLFGREA